MAAAQPNRRHFKERRDCLNEYNDRELLERFRLDAAGIWYIESLVRDDVVSGSNRNRALTPMQKVLITLRFLATGKMQLCNGDDMGVSQPTVSRAITATVRSLSSNRLIAQFIRFPLTAREIREKHEAFYAAAQFPSNVGAIDGTHVQITAPTTYENEFVNRHHYHSINVQIVVDAKYNILDIVAKWPGSTHDVRILAESVLRQLFENHHTPIHTHLIGESGYFWEVFLKRRFHVLHGEIRMSPDKACQIILACAVISAN
ncbi:putative nuclease HARBI1 [Liolophura sinensis]|uniref:putative nuclease HARBI1 n=1 Tax=Liolophura sinensis TaxID=3198878 RepID=UPI003159917B